jgi:hypothetical protein
MAVKAKAKAKAKRNSWDEEVARQVEIFKMASEARLELAMRAYKAQDKQTRDALDLIVARLRTLSTGQIRIFPEGKTGRSVVVPIEPATIDSNILFLATEILKDLALMDVKVANYEFPSVYCAECGEKLTPSKRAKAKVRRK